MKNESKLQIPIPDKLKKNLVKKSESMGFSSVNELVRVVLQNFVQSDTLLKFMPQAEEKTLYLDVEAEKRLSESLENYKAGRYTSIDTSKTGELDKWIDGLG